MENTSCPTPDDDIKKQVEKIVAAERNTTNSRKPEEPTELTPFFVDGCLENNECGDGAIFVACNCNQFIYSKSSQDWFNWAGHHWDRDVFELSSHGVEKVAAVYLTRMEQVNLAIEQNAKAEKPIGKLEKKRKALLRRIKRLRSEHGRRNTLRMSHTIGKDSIAIKGDEWDRKPWLLPCRNGVICLQTGELRPGRPEDYLLKASPVEFKGLKAPAPEWEKFLLEIFSADEEMVFFIQRLFGYSLIGQVMEHILPVFWGQGRNGKGTLLETLALVMDELAGPVVSELLLDQGRAKSSSAPSPEIMALKGRRLCWASESDEGRRFSSSKVKWLSGGDSLVGRHPHDKFEETFQPSHLLLLLTNKRPHPPYSDFAFWERALLIHFKLSFVNRDPEQEDERRSDPELKEKLKAELPGILAWMVRGCLAYQQQGLNPPAGVREDTKQYRKDEDPLAEWEDERVEKGSDYSARATDAYNDFSAFWERTVGKKIPSQRRFGEWLNDGRGYRRVKDEYGIFYTGFRLKPSAEPLG